jgi:hypothetical protein
MDCGLCVAALSFPEQLLVWGLRQWMAGRENWPSVEREFRRACPGAAGIIAATALADTIGLLAASARRPVTCFPLCARAIAADEEVLIALIAAAQVHDRRHAEARAHDLMPACMVPVLLESANVLGAALAAADRRLPPRYAMAPPGTTVH